MASVNKIEIAVVVFCILISASGILSTTVEDLKAAICGPSKGLYTIDDLVSPSVWSLNYTDNTTACIGKNNQTIGCDFMFAFCHAYNCSITNTSLMNASACLTVEAKNKSESKMYKLGSYDPNVNPFQDAAEGTISKFVVHYTNGSPYKTSDNKTCKLLMDMTFTCNQYGLWRSKGQSKPTVNRTLLKSIRYDPLICKYSLDFNYNGACPVVVPFDVTVESLSAGTVLIIIFCVCLTLYCVVGSTIKCLQGNRGKEILPNSNFWVMLPVYIADGFIFTFEKCCMCRTATDARYDSI